jgi:hypothetical protein
MTMLQRSLFTFAIGALCVVGPLAAQEKGRNPVVPTVKPTARAKPTGPAKPYTPSKTPWGDPDLQGLWPGSVNIPLQRPESFGERNTLTEAEFKERDEAGYNRALGGNWIEYYPADWQASLIVDPKNGRLPPMLPEAEARNKAFRDGLGPPTLASVEQRAWSWTDFDQWGRCITKGLIGSMLPGNLYNKGNRIIQSPGLFILQNEMVHETRIIPLDGRPHPGPGVKMWMGDGRGRWEGNTLVVETTNFLNGISMNGLNFANLTDKLKITERFTMIGPNELSYDATVEDPGTWTRPWTMHVPFTRDNEYELYEYACHESNYGMMNILKGARMDEKKAAEGNK